MFVFHARRFFFPTKSFRACSNPVHFLRVFQICANCQRLRFVFPIEIYAAALRPRDPKAHAQDIFSSLFRNSYQTSQTASSHFAPKGSTFLCCAVTAVLPAVAATDGSCFKKAKFKSLPMEFSMQQELQTCLPVQAFELRPASGSLLDLSALLLDKNGMVRDSRDFVFYNQRAHHEDALHFPSYADLHRRNDLWVDMSKLPQSVEKVVFVLSAFNARDAHPVSGGSGPCVRLTASQNLDAPAFFSFTLPFFPTPNAAVAVGELTRAEGGWKFTVGGKTYAGGLMGVCLEHGVNVA